jgi:hypothetical protein
MLHLFVNYIYKQGPTVITPENKMLPKTITTKNGLSVIQASPEVGVKSRCLVGTLDCTTGLEVSISGNNQKEYQDSLKTRKENLIGTLGKLGWLPKTTGYPIQFGVLNANAGHTATVMLGSKIFCSSNPDTVTIEELQHTMMDGFVSGGIVTAPFKPENKYKIRQEEHQIEIGRRPYYEYSCGARSLFVAEMIAQLEDLWVLAREADGHHPVANKSGGTQATLNNWVRENLTIMAANINHMCHEGILKEASEINSDFREPNMPPMVTKEQRRNFLLSGRYTKPDSYTQNGDTISRVNQRLSKVWSASDNPVERTLKNLEN